jgi:hypothetical protein
LLLLGANLVRAETVHSLGFDLSSYDDVVVGQNENFDLETRQYGLSWRLLPETGPVSGASLWWSDASREWDRPASLQREQLGGQLSVSHTLGASEYSLGLFLSGHEMETLLAIPVCTGPCLEQVRSWSLALQLQRGWSVQALTLTPSAGVIYLQERRKQTQQIAQVLNSTFSERAEGWSLELGLALGYDYELSDSWIFSPYLDLNWSEPLDLSSSGTRSDQLVGRVGNPGRSRSIRYGAVYEDYLSGAAGLSWMWRDWLFDLSWSAIIHPSHDTDPGPQLRAGLTWTH